MNPKTDVSAFFLELYQRMSLKSPKFFQVLQFVGSVAALITGIPLFLQQVEMFAGIKVNLPEMVNGVFIRVVFWCGLIVKIMGKLPVIPSVYTDEEKKDALPFTEKQTLARSSHIHTS